MRILINNPFYYPNMKGGAEQSVKLLAEGLVKNGHTVAIYCVDSKSDEMKLEEYNGVTVYRGSTHKFHIYRFSYEKNKIKKIEKVHQKLLSWYNRDCIKDFEYVCKNFKPDVVHSNGTYGMSQFIWKKANEMGIPVIHTIRDTGIVSPVQYGHKSNVFVKLIHRVKTSYTTSFISAVTAPSTYTLKTSLETGFFKNVKITKCIFNSVSIDKSEMQLIFEEKKKRDSSIIKFMYAGRLVYFKGIEHMIEAFEKLAYKDCELHICGNGEMVKYVEDWAKKDSRIVFHGMLDNASLAEVYKSSDVLLVPSYWPEPFGRVLIEGNMYGLPVIAGECGGMPEIIDTIQGGLKYQPGSAEELVKCMDQLCDREKITSYFENIMEKIDIYDISNQIKSYELLYDELIRTR